MPLTTDSRVALIDIAVRLHCASTVLNKDAAAVIDTATAFAAFAEAGSDAPPAKPVRGKAKPQDPPPVVAVDETAAEAASVETKTQPAETKAVVKNEPAKDETPSVSEADVKAAVGKVATNAAAGGAPKAREILAKYNATNISTLKPADYAKAHADLIAVLKAAEEAAGLAA